MQYIFRTYAERFAPIFRKKINGNCNRKILRDNGKLKPNFVENLQRQFSDFSNIKTILSRKTLWKIENRTKRWVTNQVCVTFENRKPNVVDKRCVDFFSSWKYNTAFNSGLKIWRVSGKSEMAQLFNLKFFLYLCWLGVGSSPQFSSRETLCATYFPNLRRKLFSYFFRKKFIEIITEKFCVIVENRTELCR